jgi:hypothetical protein
MPIHDPLTQKPYNIDKYAGVNGSPFFFDNWMRATIVTTKGPYELAQVKFDAYDNILQFNQNEDLFEVSDKIVSFQFFAKTDDKNPTYYFEKGFTGNGLKSDQFVLVLAKGTISFIRAESKAVTDVNQINVGLIKTFTNVTRWYLVKGNIAQLVRLNKTEILPLLADKAEQIQSYINSQSLSLKKEDDFIKLIKYYNSLL